MTTIANTTAPNSPNMNQPITNATTEPKPIAPQFTVTAIFLSSYALVNVIDPPLEPVSISWLSVGNL